MGLQVEDERQEEKEYDEDEDVTLRSHTWFHIDGF